MPRQIPLLIVDDIILPTAETDIGLSEGEFLALSATLSAEGGLAGIVSRPPGHQPRTSLERKVSPDNPGPIMRVCLFGSATLLAPDALDDSHRLHLTDIVRGRLDTVHGAVSAEDEEGVVEADVDVWRADISAHPLDGDFPEHFVLEDCYQGFLRLLIATRDPDASGDTLRLQLSRPLRELESTTSPVSRLWLLADYLFERPEMRVGLLQSATLEQLAETVADALEVAQTGIAVSPGALARPLTATIVAASTVPMEALADLARIASALVPTVLANEQSDGLIAEAKALTEAAEQLDRQVGKFVERLSKAVNKRPERR